MVEMTTVDRSTILGAASCGDLDTIRSHFRQPVVMKSIADINHRLQIAYTVALRENETPFIDYTRSRGGRSWLQELLLNQPAKGDHVHVFEWFFGEEAYEIIGGTVRTLLYRVFCRVIWAPKYSMELTEIILNSYLYQSMSPIEREFASSMMLTVPIESKKPSVVRLLVTHGASLMDPAKKLEYCAVDGDGLTAQMLFHCGLFAVAHQVLGKTVTKRNHDVAEVFLKNGMDAQAVSTKSRRL